MSNAYTNSTLSGLPNETLFTPDCPDFRQAGPPAGEAGIRGYSYSTPSELSGMHIDYQRTMCAKK